MAETKEVKETKKVKVFVGTYSEAAMVVAKGKIEKLKEKGFEGAKLIPGKKYMHIVTGEYTQEEAEKTMKSLAAAGFVGAILED